MTSPVANAARIVAELRERLKSEYGLQDGEDVLEDTLEGQTDLPELLATMARDAVQAEDYAEAIKGRMQAIAERKSRLEGRAVKLRNAIAWALQEAGWKRIPNDALPEMTAVLTNGKRPLVVENEDELPDALFRFKTIKTLDRMSLREALERGEQFAAARLGNAQPILTVRVR